MTYETFNHLTLYIPHGKDSSNMNFGLVDGRPRITIFDKSIPGSGLKFINIKLTAVALSSLIGLIKKAATEMNPLYTFTSFDNVFRDNERTDEVTAIGSLIISKADDGTLCLTATKTESGKLVFRITAEGIYHKIKKGDTPISKRDLSEVTATEYANLVRDIYAKAMYDNRKIKEK